MIVVVLKGEDRFHRQHAGHPQSPACTGPPAQGTLMPESTAVRTQFLSPCPECYPAEERLAAE